MAPLVALLFVVKTIIRSVGPSHSAKVQQLPAEWQNNESIFALFSPPPRSRLSQNRTLLIAFKHELNLFFNKKFANASLLFVYFRSVQTNNSILTTNQ